MAYKKDFSLRVGKCGMYSKHAEGMFKTPPTANNWSVLSSSSALDFIMVRFSWWWLQPNNSGTLGPPYTNYTFNNLDPVFEKCKELRKHFKLQLMFISESCPNNWAGAKDVSLLPRFMFGTEGNGFALDPDQAKGAYGGGVYMITIGSGATAKRKLWPRMWVPGVYNELALFCKNLLTYIRNHPDGEWFDGLVLSETYMQQCNVVCKGNSIDELNFTSERLKTGWMTVTDAIADTWNEPLHMIFLNHGLLNISGGGTSGMTKAHWNEWFDKAFTQQGFAISSPDTWNVGKEHENDRDPTARCLAANLTRVDDSSKPVAKLAIDEYRNKTIVIATMQQPSYLCLSPDRILKWASNQRREVFGSASCPDGINASAFIGAPAVKDDTNIWGIEEFADYLEGGFVPHKTMPIGAFWEDTGAAVKIAPVTNVEKGANASGAEILKWTLPSSNADRSGIKAWASTDAAGNAVVGTVKTLGAAVTQVLVSALAPPASEHYLNVQALATNASGKADSNLAQLFVEDTTDVSAPSNVCVNFAEQKITWTYIDASTPAVGFEVLIDGEVYRYAGPKSRSVPKTNASWVNGERIVRVVAVGGSARRGLSVTFTASSPTTGTTTVCAVGSAPTYCDGAANQRDALCPWPQLDSTSVDSVFANRHNTLRNTLVENLSATKDVIFIGDSNTRAWDIQTGEGGDVGGATSPWSEFKSFSVNAGMNGDRIQHAYWRVLGGSISDDRMTYSLTTNLKPYFALYKPKVVVLSIGTNNGSTDRQLPDATNAERIERNRDGIAQIVTAINTQSSTTKILLIPPIPRRGTDTTFLTDQNNISLATALKALYPVGNAQKVTVLECRLQLANSESAGDVKTRLYQLQSGQYIHLNTAGYRVWADRIKGTLATLRSS